MITQREVSETSNQECPLPLRNVLLHAPQLPILDDFTLFRQPALLEHFKEWNRSLRLLVDYIKQDLHPLGAIRVRLGVHDPRAVWARERESKQGAVAKYAVDAGRGATVNNSQRRSVARARSLLVVILVITQLEIRAQHPNAALPRGL